MLPIVASRPERAVLAPWPKRMNSPPSRLKELGFNHKTFMDDTVPSLITES